MKKKYIKPAMAPVHIDTLLMAPTSVTLDQTTSTTSQWSNRYDGSIWGNGDTDEDDGSWF